MKTGQIFIGDIRKCTKYEAHNIFSSSFFIGDECIGSDAFGYIDLESEIYKENAILIKIENGGYVDLERFNSILDYIRIYKDIRKDGYMLGGLMMPTSANNINSLFVDEESLKPYYTTKKIPKNISLRKLKKEVANNNKRDLDY